MKPALFLVFILTGVKCFSQQATIAGIVFDKQNRDRVASVNIRNITQNISIYNSLKGDFKIIARPGDKLIFSKPDFHPDTVTVQNNAALAIYLERLAIQLREVNIRDSLLTPETRLAATKRDYSKVYGSLAYNNFLSSGNGDGIGAGISIDAIFNALSRSGRNAARLRQIIESDYQQNVIDFRFNRTYVAGITGLKDKRLTDFMTRYRPGYYTTTTASDYDYITMIKSNLRRFLRNPRSYTLPPLVVK